MGQLHRDRYYQFARDRAWDLATGDEVLLADVLGAPAGDRPPLASLGEVLDHGRDGHPRWIVANAASGQTAVRDVASEAWARGFVPLAVHVYRQLHRVLAEDLAERALCLIARPAQPLDEAHWALLAAVSRSPRPHVLVTFRARTGRTDAQTSCYAVHEARSAYGAQRSRPVPASPVPADVMQHIIRGARAAEFVRAGRHAAAERLLRDVAGALARRRASAAAADMYMRLGQLLLERGRATQADNAFRDAAELPELEPAVNRRARLWQAAARTDLTQLTSAESLCRAVLLSEGLDSAARREAEAALARVLLWQGRGDEAAEFACVIADDPGDTPFVRATAVRVLVAVGQLSAAGLRARTLIAAADSSAEPLARVAARVAHLRVLVRTGDMVLVNACLQEVEREARRARVPLRLARARVLWVDAARRAGEHGAAKPVLKALERVRAAAPPLLRAEIDRCLRGAPAAAGLRAGPFAVSVPAAARTLVTLAQREENDRQAVDQLLTFAARTLDTSRLDLWSADAGPVTVLLSCGTGLPTRLGGRVLEAGIAIGPEQGDAAHEIGVPVRLGPRLIAALVGRWPPDRLPPPQAAELLDLTAAIAAVRIDTMVATAREAAQAASTIPELVGTSAAMAEVRRAVARAAAAPFAVLIEGESGVGKELVARAIHQLSARRERRFADLNCAALPDDLIEAELFGFARGAFTGAVADRAGVIEDADGGTLFLDEVADLSARAQAKLLRVVQQQEVRRVGETFSRKVDVRFVAAANRDLRAESEAGRFRQDLLYRLDVIRIRIPPLRDRPEDVPLLATHFWTAAAARVGTTATLTHAVLVALSRYHWPGNVRELQNVMAALAVEAPGRGLVRPSLLPKALTGAAAAAAGRLSDARAGFERRFVELTLARCGGSRTRAAREMGLSRQGLLKLMGRLGMSGPSDHR